MTADELRRHPMRIAAEAALGGRGFLRRDRGEALYVTDAPARGHLSAQAPLSAAGFRVQACGALWRLWPERIWIERTRAWLDEKCPLDELTRLADLRRGRAESPDEYALFLAGVKLLEGGADAAVFERLARQIFAACLREGTGGLLFAPCACLNAYRRARVGECS